MNPTLRTAGLIAGHLIYWSWNLTLLLILTTGFMPLVWWTMAIGTWHGIVPVDLSVLAATFALLPLPFMAVGLLKLRHDPGRLLSLFYGVQIPLMLLIGVRVFAIGQLTAPVAIGLVAVLISCLSLLRTLLHGFEEGSDLAQGVRQVGAAASLTVGLWGAAVLGLYTVVFTLILGRLFLREIYLSSFFLDGLLAVGFGLATLAVFAVFPFAAVGVAIRGWQVVHRATSARFGVGRTWALTALTVAAIVGPLIALRHQPQTEAFAHIAAAQTDADRRALLADRDAIRAGLLAARLGPTWYFESDPEGDHIKGLYREFLPRELTWVPAWIWSSLMSPFTYHPVDDGWVRGPDRGSSVPRDVANASEAYAALFDVPMSRAERDILLSAMARTWSWQSAQASMLDIGQQRVHLAEQEIAVEPDGDWATITIHDVYRNRTWQDQEVLLFFTLPETAAVTGLWLGHSPNRAQADTHIVAPRGAAQEVYEAEVSRGVDPALLEQVGPRQYRLRAFPVEAREGDTDRPSSLTAEGPPLHLWLEVVVPRVQGAYPLPRATEVRNLFWDLGTTRSPLDAWLPDTVTAAPGDATTHTARIGPWQVTATPATADTAPLGRLAVLVDASTSMDRHRAGVAAAIDQLRSAGTVQLYCTREALVQPCDDYDPHTALAFGSASLGTQIRGWTPSEADARIVLSDGGSYNLAPPTPTALPHGPPLWLLHVDGTMPDAYGDPVLDELQRSGGGIASTVEELHGRISDPDVRDGFRWAITPHDGPWSEELTGDEAFVPVAARAAIRELSGRLEVPTPEGLDALHTIAIGGDVVTPYSSMIVLVSQRQRDALEAASARDDRFEREITDTDSFVAVPEPTTWLLLALGGGIVGWGRRQRRGAVSDRTAS